MHCSPLSTMSPITCSITRAFSMDRSSDGRPSLFQISCSLSVQRKRLRSNSGKRKVASSPCSSALTAPGRPGPAHTPTRYNRDLGTDASENVNMDRTLKSLILRDCFTATIICENHKIHKKI